jgi:hypothetical protein
MLSEFVTVIQSKQALKRAKIGAILVEFALAVPILIAIIYYLHDIPKYKQMNVNLGSCAHEMAGILQNISQNRSDKRITVDDIKHAAAVAYLSVYPGMTGYVLNTSGKRHAVANAPHGYMLALKGLPNGNIQKLWNVVFHLVGEGTACTSPATLRIRNDNINNYKDSMFSGVSLKAGEIKIVMICQKYYESATGYGLLDNRSWKQVSVREAFGFLLLTPKKTQSDLLVFTPKPGLFGETAPTNPT